MEDRPDLLARAVAWLTSQGVLGLFLAASATLFRRLMGFDRNHPIDTACRISA